MTLSIIRVRDVISGCDQAFLHFLAAWLHRKNEPKKKLTRIDSGAPSWTVTPAISRILFYGSKKKLFDLFPDMSTTQRMPSTVDRLLKNNYKYYEQEGSQNGGSKVIMSEIDCVTVQLAGSTTVNTSELLFWLIIAIQSSCQKMNCNAWSQSLVWWSTNPSFFFKRKFQVPVNIMSQLKSLVIWNLL